MDADFSEKLKQVLSDPEALAKISAIASGLGQSTPAGERQADITASASALGGSEKPNQLLPSIQNTDPRINLLASLKPLLREDRRERVDALTQALTIVSVMKNFRK